VDFNLNEDHLLLREMVRKYAEQELAPVAAELDQTGSFPAETVSGMADLGLLGMVVPEEYGGAGMDFTSLAIAVEEISRGCASHGVIMAVHNALMAWPLFLYGTESQKRIYLPRVCSGELLGAFALTESEAGSDAASVRTSAVAQGDHYVLNGAKMFITNSTAAQLFLVAAKTDPEAGHRGISLFLVEKETPGFSVGKHEDLMGERASGNAALSLEDVVVPKENLLGDPGGGFKILMTLLDTSRIDIGAQAVGIAQAALDASIRYAGERRQFGRPIGEHQMIQDLIAEMATRLEAARLMVLRAAWMKDTGAKRFTRESAMAKLFASDMSVYVTRQAVQIFGGYGFSREYPVERHYRDAKVTEIYEGTSQIQKMVIARTFLS